MISNLRKANQAPTLLLGFLLLSQVSYADQDGILTSIPPHDPLAASDGYFLYLDHCAACHGASLEGKEGWASSQGSDQPLAPAHDDSGHTWHHSDDELFEMTKFGFDRLMVWEDGRSGMPGYQDVLSDDEILSILVFIKGSWSPQSRAWQDQVNKLYKESWQPFQGQN